MVGSADKFQPALQPPELTAVLADRRWLSRRYPFPHFIARGVFTTEFYRALEAAFQRILAGGLSEGSDPERFSRNMLYSDAYSWNYPPELQGPLAIFYSRDWHDLLARLTKVGATGDVNAALHHHHLSSGNGTVHRDLSVGWFSRQPRADGINPMDLRRCGYTHGDTSEAGIDRRETVRAVTMIYFLANPAWHPGDGGETGLYLNAHDPVGGPAAAIPPLNNSLLVFENTPASYHSFTRNRQHPRNSVILWLHRTKDEALRRWGAHRVSTW
jgi:hypothetical protein